METQELDRSYWAEFLDALNEKLDNNDVLIVSHTDGQPEPVGLESANLLSVDFDAENDEISILFFGKDFAIKGVSSMEAELDCDELSGLEINGKEGCRCVIRFNNPVHLPRVALAA